MAGLENGRLLSVSAYPVAWRIEIVDDDIHRGFEYVRSECYAPSLRRNDLLTLYVSFRWGTTKVSWNIAGFNKGPGSKVRCRVILRNHY